MKILIVDKDAVSRQLLESLLSRWGYEVLAAPDGPAALEMLRKAEGPKFAILSQMTPGANGLEVCREIRKQDDPSYVYTLLLLGGPDPEVIRAAVQAGADDYLTSPLQEDEMKVRLRAGRRILGLRHELQDAQAALSYQVSHDPLTGLINRTAILDILRRELARVRREKSPVGVIAVQIDNFKAINQKYGSAVGDAVLRGTARKLRSAVRPYDSVGRFGAEEFLVIVPGSDIREALSQAERFRVAVVTEAVEVGEWGKHLPPGEGSLAVTVSLGVVASSQVLDAERLVRAADAALARARTVGPNRVEMTTPEELATS